MAVDTKILQDTTYSGLYGAYYDAWDEEAVELIHDYQNKMAGLNSQRIVDHHILSADVTETVYENGAQVYVNYGDKDFKTGDITVPARS